MVTNVEALVHGDLIDLMTQTRATISFAPSFGYDLCARRLRDADVAKYDLSNWRIAGIGAEMIRPQTLDLFADIILTPSFPEAEFERLRKQQLAAIQREKTRPLRAL